MAKLLPKKVLDSNLLKELAKYYKIDTSSKSWNPDEFIEWECFSHPSLEYHDCNIRAKLFGGHVCKYCKHIPGRPCVISCDFQHFCLAVYAWRIGIGGSDLHKALNHNLYKLDNEELYGEVIKVLSNEALEEVQDCSNQSCTSCEASQESSYNPTEVLEDTEAHESELSVSEGVRTSEDDITEFGKTVFEPCDDKLTIKEAADYYGCTYCNIYNYVNKGRISHEVIDQEGKKPKVLIKKSDLDEFKAKHCKRRSRKN